VVSLLLGTGGPFTREGRGVANPPLSSPEGKGFGRKEKKAWNWFCPPATVLKKAKGTKPGRDVLLSVKPGLGEIAGEVGGKRLIAAGGGSFLSSYNRRLFPLPRGILLEPLT